MQIVVFILTWLRNIHTNFVASLQRNGNYLVCIYMCIHTHMYNVYIGVHCRLNFRVETQPSASYSRPPFLSIAFQASPQGARAQAPSGPLSHTDTPVLLLSAKSPIPLLTPPPFLLTLVPTVRIDMCTSVTVGSGKHLLAFTVAAQQQRRRRCRGSSGSVARRRSSGAVGEPAGATVVVGGHIPSLAARSLDRY